MEWLLFAPSMEPLLDVSWMASSIVVPNHGNGEKRSLWVRCTQILFFFERKVNSDIIELFE